MISPLTQRQTLQTATLETVRLATEGASQVQQEIARRQSLDAKQAEARAHVADVESTDAMRLRDRGSRGQAGRHDRGAGKEPESSETSDSAEGAGPHLDLLA
jgi:hypothetical protein